MYLQPIKKRYSLGGRIIEAVDSLKGERDLPKHVRNVLDKYGDEPVQQIRIGRSPLPSALHSLFNILTAGNWKDILAKTGIDKLYHTFMIINEKFTLEKNAVITLTTPPRQIQDGDEIIRVKVNGNKTLNEMISNTRKYMGSQFIPYNIFSNNCQIFIDSVLKSNGWSTQGTHKFLKQNLEYLLKELPEWSKMIAQKGSDIGGDIENAYSAIRDKRGGVIPIPIHAKYGIFDGFDYSNNKNQGLPLFSVIHPFYRK